MFRFLTVCAMLLVAGATVWELPRLISASTDWNYFGSALLGGIVVVSLFGRHPSLAFLCTFGHELAHTIVAFTAGSTVQEFRATPGQGGHVRHSATRLRTALSLAPYCLPIGAGLATGVILLTGDPPSRTGLLAIGLLLGLHLASAAGDVRNSANAGWTGSDFGQVGVAFAAVTTTTWNLTLLAVLGSFATGGLTSTRHLVEATASRVATVTSQGMNELSRIGADLSDGVRRL